MAKRNRKIPLRYPLGAEVAYRKMLVGIVNETRRISLEEINSSGPALIAEVEAYRRSVIQDGTEFEYREDATGWTATLLRMLLRIADGIGLSLNIGLNRVAQMGDQINRANRSTFNEQIRAAYGVDILRNEPQLAPLLSAWEADNLELIKSIPVNIVAQMRGEFITAFHQGASLKDLTKIVQDRTGAGKSRAELIARDQVGKLNGQLAQSRQQSIGVREYFWRTSQDERVRPTHVVRNGKRYSWAGKETKPGQEIRCRCNAEPIFPEILGEIDEDS